jgi:hypothetical protein
MVLGRGAAESILALPGRPALVALAQVGDGCDENAVRRGQVGHALAQLPTLRRHFCHLRGAQAALAWVYNRNRVYPASVTRWPHEHGRRGARTGRSMRRGQRARQGVLLLPAGAARACGHAWLGRRGAARIKDRACGAGGRRTSCCSAARSMALRWRARRADTRLDLRLRRAAPASGGAAAPATCPHSSICCRSGERRRASSYPTRSL